MPPNCLKYLNSSRLPYMTTSIACENQPLGIPFLPIAAIPDLPLISNCSTSNIPTTVNTVILPGLYEPGSYE